MDGFSETLAVEEKGAGQHFHAGSKAKSALRCRAMLRSFSRTEAEMFFSAGLVTIATLDTGA
jgi:hypothetical protein